MTLIEYYAELQRHDWFYHFSDDHSVWQRGEVASSKMATIAKESPEHQQLFNAFGAHHFSGESFGKPKAPYPMHPEALPALKLSIEHWRRLATGARNKDEEVSVLQCDLCAKFHIPIEDYRQKCKGCPVMQFSGKQFCYETPFVYAESLSEEDQPYLDTEEFMDAAQKELEFLESLIPPPTDYVFFRNDGFYTVPLPYGDSLTKAAELNPGTIKIETVDGKQVWPIMP